MPKIGLQIEVKLNTGAFSTMALQASKNGENHDAALNEIFVNLLGRYLATQGCSLRSLALLRESLNRRQRMQSLQQRY
ncbi:Uncharacterised protein [Escherichia coli]|uniref:Uncharacterized protein n=1 Tax=Escherichia coli TaxID=562 RepID=A0A484YRA8_ECOLX|nr:Uncharacterised protein [Escherichia coli]